MARKSPEIQVNIHGGEDIANMADELGFHYDIRTDSAERAIDESRVKKMRERRMKAARPNRGDTGVQVFGKDGLKSVSVDEFFADLAANGYVPVDAMYMSMPKRDRATGNIIPNQYKFVMRLTFGCEADDKDISGPDDDVVGDFRKAVGDLVFSYCHVWLNDSTETVNLLGDKRPIRPGRSFNALRFSLGAGPKECNYTTELMDSV